MDVNSLMRGLEVVLSDDFINLKRLDEAKDYLVKQGFSEQLSDVELAYLMDLKEQIIFYGTDLRTISLIGEPLNAPTGRVQYSSTSEVDGLDKTFFGMSVRKHAFDLEQGRVSVVYLTDVIADAIKQGSDALFKKSMYDKFKTLFFELVNN